MRQLHRKCRPKTGRRRPVPHRACDCRVALVLAWVGIDASGSDDWAGRPSWAFCQRQAFGVAGASRIAATVGPGTLVLQK